VSALQEEIRSVVAAELERALRPLRELLERGGGSANDDEALDLREAARISGYQPDTLRRAIRRGTLPAIRGAKEWRVRRADLLAWQGRPGSAPSVLDERAEARKMLGLGPDEP